MSMMELHSLEAEHGVLAAMLIQPQLIDILTEELSAAAFAWDENAELFQLILDQHNEGQPVDIITLSDRQPFLGEQRTLAYAGEIQSNSVGVANAKEYARIVRERFVSRQIADLAARIHELAHENSPAETKMAEAQSMIMALDAKGKNAECHTIKELIAAHIDILEERHQRTVSGNLFEGLATGIPDLDKYTMGLKAGQMIVLAGRPAMGKTTLAMNIAADAAIKQKKNVLVISLEMTKEQLTDRLLACVGGIPLPALKDGSCSYKNETELAAATLKLSKSSITITDVPVMTMPRIRAIARREKNRMGDLGLIAIDYLGLVEGDGNGRVDDVTAMSRQVKLLAREMGCPIILLCQLNRGCESRPDKRPVLSDLRESGAIEQDADVVMFVYRDEVYFPNTQDKGIGEVLIRKNRDGEIGTALTAFQGERSRFVPLEHRQVQNDRQEEW